MLTIFTTESCAWCVQVKRLLTMKGVQYQEKGIESPEYQELANLNQIRTVPVTTNGTEFVVGWNPGQLFALINKELAQ